jgi:hypothetical protein
MAPWIPRSSAATAAGLSRRASCMAPIAIFQRLTNEAPPAAKCRCQIRHAWTRFLLSRCPATRLKPVPEKVWALIK